MSAAIKRPPGRMTVDEFLAWPGDTSDARHELVDGEVIAMSPAADAHALIQAEISFLLTDHLKRARPGCHVRANPGVAPRLRRETNLRVPDLAVSCAPHRPGQVLLPDPILIVEVLSPSNERETRRNVWAYASIPSVRDILLVQSVTIRAELLSRLPGGDWPEQPTTIDAGDAVPLESIGASLPLDAFYVATALAS